jgi:hypothetical protein
MDEGERFAPPPSRAWIMQALDGREETEAAYRLWVSSQAFNLSLESYARDGREPNIPPINIFSLFFFF